jgi:hypothetical protein
MVDFDNDGLLSASDLFTFYRQPNLEKDFSVLLKQMISLKVPDEPAYPELFSSKPLTFHRVLKATNRQLDVTLTTTAKRVTVYH